MDSLIPGDFVALAAILTALHLTDLAARWKRRPTSFRRIAKLNGDYRPARFR